jgi:DnaJ-class molecular chaperone
MEPNKVECIKCRGSGYAPRKALLGTIIVFEPSVPCSKCGGSGKIDWVKQAIGEDVIKTYWWEDMGKPVL